MFFRSKNIGYCFLPWTPFLNLIISFDIFSSWFLVAGISPAVPREQRGLLQTSRVSRLCCHFTELLYFLGIYGTLWTFYNWHRIEMVIEAIIAYKLFTHYSVEYLT